MLELILIVVLIALVILLAIGVLIILGLVLALGLFLGIIFAYVRAAITYIGSVNERVENVPIRVFMIVVTALITAIPLIILAAGIISMFVA